MVKLHELLAVEGSRKGAWEKIKGETIGTFKNKVSHFQANVKTLDMLSDEDKDEEQGQTDRLAMTTTVPMKLSYMSKFFEDFIDVVYQKELTNQTARHELTVNGKTITDIPATFLLGLVPKLQAIRQIVEEIPTHAPGVEWEEDPSHEFEGVVRAKHPQQTNKTRRTLIPVVLYEATEEHPAQVAEREVDTVVGRFTTQQWSGMLSPAEKSGLLRRIDTLIEACVKARQKANEAEVIDRKIGSDLMEFILGELSLGNGVQASASDVIE